MKSTQVKFLLILFLFTVIACQDQVEAPIADVETEEVTDKLKTDFETNLFRSVISNEPSDKNVVISPVSVSSVLRMILAGADGNSATEIVQAYGEDLTADELLADARNFNNWLSTRKGNPVIELSNAIFYDMASFNPLPTYISELNKNFKAEEIKANFSNETEALNMINGWVNTKTKTRIPTILNSIDPGEVMFLVNALYLKADWLEGFDERGTSDRNFTLTDGRVIQTPMMFADRLFNNYSNEEVHVVELPYKDEEISMYLIKPLKGDVQNLIAEFSASKFNDIKEQLKKNRLMLTMPSFEVEYKNEQMTDRLKGLGIYDIFENNANLTRMAEQKNLKVSRVIHKTYITVDEKGTEGAAVTVGGIVLTSSPPQVDFDSPFMFIIADNVTNNFLFMGRVSNPKEK
jgi:serine protease inhibitor